MSEKLPMKILVVAGARPNFMKIAPIMRALRSDPTFRAVLVHTGQHYDEKLSRVFFDDLQIPRPDLELEVGSASHAQQTAEIMRRFEAVLEREQPHGVLVVGDVNSTIACALVVAKFQLAGEFRWRGRARRRPVMIHVEAGLRSFDDDMPEEINRKLTDAISDVLFVSEPVGLVNLRAEGVAESRMFFVGNVMIDTLLAARERAAASTVTGQLDLEPKAFCLLTLHRPSNVDDLGALGRLFGALDRVAQRLPIVFPVHPRTRKQMEAAKLVLDPQRWRLTDPLGYYDFLKLQASARVVFTDSGGVQEETTVLGVPCVTLRENTERPITIEEGTNILAGTSADAILAAFEEANGRQARAGAPKLWDGRAAERIAGVLRSLYAEAVLTPEAV
jgi:UDP-N-acetylglucosamine 2-epimerase (non-hydrolysing)